MTFPQLFPLKSGGRHTEAGGKKDVGEMVYMWFMIDVKDFLNTFLFTKGSGISCITDFLCQEPSTHQDKMWQKFRLKRLQL